MSKSQKKFVFVLMPFDETFSDIYNYGIKQTCTELNLYCERVDEQIFNESIIDRIYNQISKADMLIADMTNRNPNVFYEVGYAHGLGKNVILLTQNANDIPFDFKHFQHIIYNGKIKELNLQLSKKLEWYINKEYSDVIQDVDFNFDFSIDGNMINENAIIDINSNMTHSYSLFKKFRIDIYNNSSKIYKTKFKIGLEIPDEFKSLFGDAELIKSSEKSTLIMSKDISNIYPNAYKNFDVLINIPQTEEIEERIIDVKLKIFTIFELKQIKFQLKFRTQSKW